MPKLTARVRWLCWTFVVAAGALAPARGAPATAPASRPAFVGAVGYGTDTPGGRGGRILRVTTLAAAGEGSLAAAVAAKGPRTVVFEVGGVIDLGGKTLKIAEPFLTIAGQTGPAPGITLVRGQVAIQTHDVVIRHIRVRPGEAGRAKKSGWEADGMTTVGAYNVVVDHCSMSWATDEGLSASGERTVGAGPDEWRANTSHDITFSHCIIAEGLANSTHAKGEHSKGSLIHDNVANVAIVGNLYACNNDRNPMAKAGARVVVANNWVSNPGRAAMHSSCIPTEWGQFADRLIAPELALVGNVVECGPSSRKGMPFFNGGGSAAARVFMEGNIARDAAGRPMPEVAGKVERLPDRPFWPAGLDPMPADRVKEHVAKNAGARPWDRDAIDRRIVENALAGKGKVIDSEAEVGGYPNVPETREPFREDQRHLDTMERRGGGGNG